MGLFLLFVDILYCALVAQLFEHRTAMQEVASLTPAGPSLRGFKITEEKVVPL